MTPLKVAATTPQKKEPAKVSHKTQKREKPEHEKKPAKVSRKTQEHVKLQHEADVRIQHLRSVLKDVTRSYVANTEQKILDLADRISSPSQSTKGKKIQSEQLVHIIKILDTVNIKHEKGRRKDLKKIELVIDAINNSIPAEKE
jgi:hypothetical protein